MVNCFRSRRLLISERKLVKVPSLDGAGKMSKSENQLATLYLADEDDLIRKKVMKAKTDAGPPSENEAMPDYIKNLFGLMELVSDESTFKKFKADFNKASIRYGDMKKQLAEDMVKFIAPIREKANAIRSDEAYLKKVIRTGAERSRESAAKTIDAVRKAIGFNYF
jgi:tryptophanyl-tRNA synthetase